MNKKKNKFESDKNLKLCRACLAVEVQLNVLSDVLQRKSFLNLSKSKISTKSKIFLCNQCATMVKKFMQFQKMCADSDNWYRNHCDLLQKGKTSNLSDLQSNIKKSNNISPSGILVLDVCCNENKICDMFTVPCKKEADDFLGCDSDQKEVRVNCNEQKYPIVKVYNIKFCTESERRVENENTICDDEVKIKLEYNSNDDECDANNDAQVENYVIEDEQRTKLNIGDEINADKEEKLDECAVINKFDRKIRMKYSGMYSCPYCSDVFRKKSHLKIHKKINHNPVESNMCEECGESFKSAVALKYHRVVHGKSKNFVCEYCNKKFVHNSDLQRHIKIHTGEKDYVCDFCGKAFTHVANLNTHRRLHLGIKPYKCKICGKSYADNASIKYHMLTHTGEKPFQCKSCEASFRSSSELHAHNTKHTGIKPHSCDLCSFSTVRLRNLKRHKQTHIRKVKEQKVSAVS